MEQKELEAYWKAHADGYKKGWEVGYERCLDILERLNRLKDSDFCALIKCLEKMKEISIRDPINIEPKE